MKGLMCAPQHAPPPLHRGRCNTHAVLTNPCAAIRPLLPAATAKSDMKEGSGYFEIAACIALKLMVQLHAYSRALKPGRGSALAPELNSAAAAILVQ